MFLLARFAVAGALFVTITAAAQAQSARQTVSGFVHDSESGKAFIGATVSLQGTHVGTITNRCGFYSITLPADSTALAVSYIGYRSQVLIRP